jgi:4'-phosphopantetheinyl transferase EntD
VRLAAIVPAACAVVDASDDDALAIDHRDVDLLGHAVASRQREFLRGRACARQALTKLGVDAASIGRGAHREPLWPAGIVGSITHCLGYVAAAVARADVVAALGIDAEPHAPIAADVLAQVASIDERAHLAALPIGVAWDRVLFSAKESVYKAWFPLTARWLDFTDAVVTIDPDAGTFIAQLRVPSPRVPFLGRFTITADHIVTAVAVES